jgi:3-oxoacyl-[acyl-carrier protein] reductase
MSTTKPLDGKVALITGASKGIGRATALQLAADGAKVIVNYSSSSAAADEVVSLIGADRAFAVKADAGSVEGIGKLVDATVQKFGKIDIVIPCAGVMILNELEKVSEADFDTTINLNVKGPLFLTQVGVSTLSYNMTRANYPQKAVPHMSSGGRIIFFSTTLATASIVLPNYLSYVTSKGAVEQMTRVMSKDLARKGIMVNCVSPGPTATELFLKGKNEQTIKALAGANPQNRLGTPEDIAKVIGFLSGPNSAWVTGQNIKVNGGMA